ncbi:MAG: PorT family protein [Prevotellaceae bacterium]|jgi:hypothetical protein|nr:PorT family protein [Prevotellaceae bacterium]
MKQISVLGVLSIFLKSKQWSFFYCFCLFMPATVCAQHYVGIKGAQGYTTIQALPVFDRTSLQTFSPGILYRYEHKKYAALQIEMNYINKGYIKDLDTMRNTPEIANRITSIELPMMAQGFIRLGIFRPYLTGGATVGYILNRSTQVKGEQSQSYKFDKYDRKFEYGIAGGGGLAVAIQKFEIQAECRYHYNFSFLRDPIIPEQQNTYLNSTQLMFSVSLLYRLSK